MRFRRYLGLTVPVGIGAVSLVFAATTPSLVSAQTPSLPPVTAAQLLSDVLGATPQPSIGTIQEVSNFLPAGLPLSSTPLGSAGQFISGTNSFNLWRGTTSQLRVQYLAATSEQDLYVNGTSAWLWNSANQKATEISLPSSGGMTGGAGQDPQTIADQFIQQLSPYGSVTLGANTFVGGVPSYDLKISSGQSGSTIREVNIFVDSQFSQVLGVNAVTTSSSTPSFSLEYTKVAFTTPSPSVFDFTPPAGSTVKSLSPSSSTSTSSTSSTTTPTKVAPYVMGAGFEQVHVLPVGTMTKLTSSTSAQQYLPMLLAAEQAVQVPQGTDQFLSTPFVNALILPDGRVLVGTVSKAVLISDASLLGNV